MARNKRAHNSSLLTIRSTLLLLACLTFLVMAAIPLVTRWLTARPGGSPVDMRQILGVYEIALQLFLRVFVVVWIFFLGGCFASFFNVVAWRVPRGRGILGPSRCPYCNNKLPFSANLPVYGWLSSRGRCQTCKLPISPRYLIVEIVLGTIFLAIAIAGLFCGGWYLPIRPIDPDWGIAHFVLEPKFDLLQIVVYHLIVVCLLFLFALVRIDKKPIPNSVAFAALISTVGFQILWPWVQQTQWPPGPVSDTPRDLSFWTTLLMGVLGGAFCGWLMWISCSKRESKTGRRECLLGMIIVGMAFGFQFAFSVLLAILIFDALSILLGDTSRSPFQLAPTFKIGTFSLIALILWRISCQFPFWPGPFSDPLSLLFVIGITTVLAFGIANFEESLFNPNI